MTSMLLVAIPWLVLTAAPTPSLPAPDFPTLGQEILTLVRDRLLNAQRGARWAEEHVGYADGIKDRAAFRDATRSILADLKTSHTQYYTPDDPGYFDLLAIFEPVLKRDPRTESLGLAAVEQDSSWFVARVFGGGPAEAAGLKRGDRLMSADGEPFHPVLSLRGKADKAIDLQVQSRAGEAPRTIHITPRLISPKEEWLEDQRRSSRVIEWKGRRIAYAPLWSCAGPEHQELLEEVLQGDLAGADALVIDFRGGWGGCNPGFVQLFDPAAPDLTRIDRDGTRSTYSPGWRKPLAVLVDGGTRSGKELVSRALQRHKRAVLVGERTAGAVVAGQVLPLSDGSMLFLAVQDILVDGERLEGVGVKPDVEIPAALPFASGKDPQLDGALSHLNHS
jgi:carboxyl-terminal processing protease